MNANRRLTFQFIPLRKEWAKLGTHPLNCKESNSLELVSFRSHFLKTIEPKLRSLLTPLLLSLLTPPLHQSTNIVAKNLLGKSFSLLELILTLFFFQTFAFRGQIFNTVHKGISSQSSSFTGAGKLRSIAVTHSQTRQFYPAISSFH